MQLVDDDADIGVVDLGEMNQRSWSELILRDDIVGGDIESQEGDDIYRGPISSIELLGNGVVVTCSWMAVMKRMSGEWKNWHIKSFSFAAGTCRPQDIGQGRIYFRMSGLGSATIFPCGGSKLDPAKVEGLVLEHP